VNTQVSVVYSTFRAQPHFDWFADGLAAQLGDDHVEVVVVDGSGVDRADELAAVVDGRFPLRWVPAKPTVMNGPHRRTSRDLHAPSSARNSGLVAASQPYVVFVDDCAVPAPTWWTAVREASRQHYVVGGSYEKRRAMVVRDGQVVAGDPAGRDIRWETGRDDRVVAIPASHLFGCAIGAPRAALIELNGFDEICDGTGGEDCQLGLRLEHAGHRLFYDRSMHTIEADDVYSAVGQTRSRVDPVIDEATYMARLAEHGVRRRSTTGPFDAGHLVLDLVLGTRAVASLGNHYDVAELTVDDLDATAATLPERYWLDGRPWSEL
jgi:hypothetical protein